MLDEKKKQTIKLIIAVASLILLFVFIIILMLKYEVEGERNMPFNLSKMVIISTVEGNEINATHETKWNLDIVQNNDVYFYIDKNKEYDFKEDELIKSIKIENISINKVPQKGIIETYMPNSTVSKIFSYDEQFIVGESLEYKGAKQSSIPNLEIGSQGGTVVIRFCNNNIGKYTSNDDEKIIHNSDLLKKIGVTNDDIMFGVSFDFIIETTKTKYKTTIKLDLPSVDLDVQENGYIEKEDLTDIVFKREK